jgi:hypothetical protein
MEDFIYLIALIAWVAFAFYRKSQKKSEAARKEQQRPQPRDISSPFPSMKDIFDEEPSVEYIPVPATQTATTDGMAPQREESEFIKEYKLSGIRSVEEIDSPLILRKAEYTDIQEDEISDENLSNRDCRARVDLRQAVIYSEILNRPYV